MITPCIKLCKLENGRCRGCFRTLEQIKLWSQLTDKEQKQIIDENSNSRTRQTRKR